MTPAGDSDFPHSGDKVIQLKNYRAVTRIRHIEVKSVL